MLPGFDIAVQSGGTIGGAGEGASRGGFNIVFNPPSAERTTSSRNSGIVTTAAITAHPSGGTAPYTQSWTLVDGFGDISADQPLSATTTFSAFLDPGAAAHATMRITMTDASLSTAYADLPVSLTLINRNSGSGYAEL